MEKLYFYRDTYLIKIIYNKINMNRIYVKNVNINKYW